MAGYIGSKIAVTQVDGYNRTEADAEFVNDPDGAINVSNYDISFYEDTGTTPKFFWDASAEALGIGKTDRTTLSVFTVQNFNDVTTNTAEFYNDNGNRTFRFAQDTSGNATQLLEKNDGTDAILLNTNGDSYFNGGNVGIGTSSPSTLAHVKGSGDFAALTIETATTGGASYINLGDSNDLDVGQIAYYNSDDSLRIKVNASERLRINSSGQVLVSDVTRTYGNTTSPLYSAGNSDQTSGAIPLELAVASGSGGFRYLAGFSNTSGFIGSISVSGSTTSYNTTSDYRLKENVTPLSGAANRLAQIPVHRFNFISDPDTTVDGFLAHEVQAIVPEAVHGEKDAVNAKGQPEYQGIDQSKLVPLLTAALQEALQKIDALEARVAALEAV